MNAVPRGTRSERVDARPSRIAVTAGRTREVALWCGRRVGAGARRAPLTFAITAALWILAAVFGAHGTDRGVLGRVAVGGDVFRYGDPRTLVLSGLFAFDWWSLVGTTVVLLVVGLSLEPRFSRRRLVAAAVFSQVLGSFVAVGFASGLASMRGGWGNALHIEHATGPSTWILGMALAASTRMSALWRRRLRVGVLAVLIVLALFGGTLQDIVRLGGGLVGLVVGPLLWRDPHRAGRLRAPTGTRHETRMLVAVVVAAAAAGPVVAAMSPHAAGPLAVFGDFIRSVPIGADEVREICGESGADAECRHARLLFALHGVGPLLLSLMPGLVLVVIADGLRRGRRAAWIGAVVIEMLWLLVVVGIFVLLPMDAEIHDGQGPVHAHLLLRYSIAPVAAPLLVLAVLLVTRRRFTVRAARGTAARSVAIIVGSLGVLFGAYLASAYAFAGDFDRKPAFAALAQEFPLRLVPPVFLQFVDPLLTPMQGVAAVVFGWLGVVFWTVVAATLFASFVRPRYEDDTAAGRRLRELLRTPGGGALSWMTTWEGNRYRAFAGDRGVIAHRVIAGVALTTGDPVCERGAAPDVVRDFADHCAAAGWTPCLYSVGEETADIARGLGWQVVRVAEETVLNPEGLAFKGKRFQDIRTAINRARREGIRAEWMRYPDAPVEVAAQIAEISEEWVAEKGMPEMGFTLGGLDELDDPEVRLLVALDEGGRVHGVTSWLPVFRDGETVGLTMDFMRRRADGFRPAMEFLIASAALDAAKEGLEVLSLSGAPLATLDGEDELVGLAAVLDVLGRGLEPVYGFRSLLAFKKKFDPEYRPLYMAFPDPGALPAIGIAVGQAYLPSVSPGQGARLLGRLLRVGSGRR